MKHGRTNVRVCKHGRIDESTCKHGEISERMVVRNGSQSSVGRHSAGQRGSRRHSGAHAKASSAYSARLSSSRTNLKNSHAKKRSKLALPLASMFTTVVLVAGVGVVGYGMASANDEAQEPKLVGLRETTSTETSVGQLAENLRAKGYNVAVSAIADESDADNASASSDDTDGANLGSNASANGKLANSQSLAQSESGQSNSQSESDAQSSAQSTNNQSTGTQSANGQSESEQSTNSQSANTQSTAKSSSTQSSQKGSLASYASSGFNITAAANQIDLKHEQEKKAAEEAQKKKDDEAKQRAEKLQKEWDASEALLGLEEVDWSVGETAFLEEWTRRIDNYLKGTALAGYGSTFARASWDNGVDPRWSPAISNTESGNGANCFHPHNAWGWAQTSWNSWEDAIKAHVAGLAKGYGYSITYANAQKYCPPNTDFWFNNTLSQMKKI